MSAVVWHTTLVSRLGPGVDLLDEVLRRARRGEPIGIAAVSLLEISYGTGKAVRLGRADFARLQSWFRGLIASRVARVFALGADGALLAGEVRALMPTPPEGRRPRTRSKAEARVAWTHDIQIACAAWEAGHDIATVDVDHFTVIDGCIKRPRTGGGGPQRHRFAWAARLIRAVTQGSDCVPAGRPTPELDPKAERYPAGVRTLILEPSSTGLREILERRRGTGLDRLDEVWDGVLHMVPAPSVAHADIAQQLAVILDGPARSAGLLPTMHEFNLGASEHNFRVPDGGLHRGRPGGAWVATAALVVEIVSPGDESWEKLPFYADHGVDEVLVVDPTERVAHWRALVDGAYRPVDRSGLIEFGAAELASRIDWPTGAAG